MTDVGGGGSFANLASGTLRKSAGVDAHTFENGVAFSNAGTVQVQAGALEFDGGFTQSAGATQLNGTGLAGTGAFLFSGGTLTGAGTIAASVMNNGATITPGGAAAAGKITITGNYTQSGSGTLAADIGGTTAGTQYDQLAVSGTATLGGALNATQLGGFTPVGGNSFDVVTAATRTGTFGTVTTGGLNLVANYTSTAAQLVAPAALTYMWDAGGGADTSWFTPANWSPDGVPGALDTAILNTNATINLASDASIGMFQQSNGTFTSPAGVTFTILNNFTWTGGTMSGSGVTNANGGITMNGAGVVLIGRTLHNAAGQTATLSGLNAALVLAGGGAVFNNDGTFLAQNNSGFPTGGVGTNTFNNAGVFTRDTSSGEFYLTFNGAFNNTGTVNVQSGTLRLLSPDGGATSGDFNVSSGATLLFQNDFTLGPTSDVAGAGAVQFGGNTINVNGSYNVSGLTTFSIGTANFSNALSSLSVGPVVISNGTANFGANSFTIPTLALSNGVLDGTGTINISGPFNWTGGKISGSGVMNANGGITMNGAGVNLIGRTLHNPAGQTATLSGPMRCWSWLEAAPSLTTTALFWRRTTMAFSSAASGPTPLTTQASSLGIPAAATATSASTVPSITPAPSTCRPAPSICKAGAPAPASLMCKAVRLSTFPQACMRSVVR
jgi:hypothetical protein